MQNLADGHRCFYLPYSEDANMVAELPNQAGLFFTTQKVLSANIGGTLELSLLLKHFT